MYNKELIEEIAHSWKIEGITLTSNELTHPIDLYNNWIKMVKNSTLWCELEFNYEQGQDYEHYFYGLQELHGKLFPELKDGGKLRPYNVTVGGSPTTHYTFLEKEFLHFCRTFLNPYKASYKMVGKAHVEFEIIHPFCDGNGRLGRMLIPILCVEYGLKPVFLSKYFYENRQGYYNALSAYRYGNTFVWYDYFNKGLDLCLKNKK